MNGILRFLCCSAFLMSAPLVAQTPCLSIEGAEVFLPGGPMSGVTVVVEGTQIRSVLMAGGVGDGCTSIDAKGLILTPGFIAAHTSLGLLEVSQEDFTRDSSPKEGASLRPAFEVFWAYNPRSTLIPITRSRGVTTAIVTPVGGLVSGMGAAVDLKGASQAEAIIDSKVALYIDLGGNSGSRAEDLFKVVTLLKNARTYRLMKGQWLEGNSRPFLTSPEDLEALYPVLDGDIPLVVAVNRASDIEACLRALEPFQSLKLIVRGGAEGHLVASLLKEAGAFVMLDPRMYGPGSFDTLHGRKDNAALLTEAGVPVIIVGEGKHRAGSLNVLAGNAVRGGLSHDAAIQGITSNPAEAFGLSGRGKIEEGALANLVLWDGDPLEIQSEVVHLYIRGESVSLETRQSLLLERYRTLPVADMQPLSLPESK